MLSRFKNKGAVTGYANLTEDKKQIIKEFTKNQYLKNQFFESKIPTVQEQITSIELALVEIYEVMLND